MEAVNAAVAVGSKGVNSLSAGMKTATAVVLLPVNIAGAAFARVGAGISAITPYPIRLAAAWIWGFMPEFDSPVVIVIMMVQFASDIQWYKRMARLLWKMVSGSGKEAACDFW